MECYTSTFNVRREKVIQQWNVTTVMLMLDQQWNVTRQHVNVRREKEKVIQQWNVTRQHLTLEEKQLFNSGMLHVNI